MILIQLFLALFWGFVCIGVLAGGIAFAYNYALDSDRDGVKVLPAIWGVVWRLLATICLLTIVVGVPLQLIFN